MSSRIHLRLRPEEDELRLKCSELDDLERELVEKELQLAGLRSELAAFEQLYLKTVGALYAELDEIQARIAELIASRSPSNVDAQATARVARQKAAESRSAVGEAALHVAKRIGPSPELKDLYREVARRIHPDLAIDEADRARRQQFMAQANRAYEDGDEARLKSILEEYDSSPDTVAGDGIGADLVRVIRKISQVKRRLTEIDEELNRFMQSELMDLKNRVDEGTKQGREVLAEMASTVGRRVEEARRELSSLSKERTS